MLGTRHDSTVTLDSDFPITETEIAYQFFDGRPNVHGSRLSVDDHID